MMGLLYKDIIASKKFILLTWLMSIAFSIGQHFDPISMKHMLVLVLIFSYAILLVRYFQAEEKNSTMVLLKTLPISYYVIVGEKYLLCLLTSMSSLILFSIITLFPPGAGIDGWSEISPLFVIYLIIIGTSISSLGIYISFRWGSAYLNVFVMAIYILAIATVQYILPNITITQNIQNIIIIGLLPLLCVFLFMLSIHAVKTRNFLKD